MSTEQQVHKKSPSSDRVWSAIAGAVFLIIFALIVVTVILAPYEYDRDPWEEPSMEGYIESELLDCAGENRSRKQCNQEAVERCGQLIPQIMYEKKHPNLGCEDLVAGVVAGVMIPDWKEDK